MKIAPDLDRLGDEIALLSAHLDAATACLLALIRDFDARGGWNNGFRSCAEWLSWRVGLDLSAARERVRVARALATLHDAPVLADPKQPGQSLLEDGARVSAETVQRLACDASRVVVRHDADGRVLEVGARTRTISPAIRRALLHRDRTCRFPGCCGRFTQGHHIHHWAHGGPTTLSNLALLCRRHHRAVHEEGYQVERLPDGALRFRRPDGRLLPDVPPPAAVPAEPVERLHARHAAQGLRLHARTTCPTWLGERLDLGYAIDVLHPLVRTRGRGPSP